MYKEVKKNENNSEKEQKITIKEIITNKRYRAIAALIFYSVIILILIGYVRMAPNNDSSTSSDIVPVMSKVSDKNFDFRFTLTDGEITKEFVGKQFSNKILFTDLSTQKNYFVKDDMVLEESDGKYILSNNPTEYFNYLDIDLINNILKTATKDENDYVISAVSFSELIGYSATDDISDFDILIETDSSDTDLLITFDLDEYAKNVLGNSDNLKLELEYSNFGNIEDFNVN